MLHALCLMPPKLGQLRRGAAPGATDLCISRQIGGAVRLPLPLFWDSPPWHTWTPQVAQATFEAMQSRGVLVSVLESELGRYPTGWEGLTSQSSASAITENGANSAATSDAKLGIPRMMPYRNERYGLADSDFDHVSVVDVQLSPPRDVSGRFAYSASRIGRWEGTPDESPLSGGGWVPAMTLPPDVPGPHQLESKIMQLRGLSPQSAIIVSVTPEWIDEHLDDLIAAAPDALLIRLGQLRMSGIAFAHFVRRLLARVQSIGQIPIWLSPPKSLEKKTLSVSDSIKTLALGASAIAVDCWLEEAIDEIDEIPAPSSFDSNPDRTVMANVEEILQRLFDEQIESFVGLHSSLIHDRPEELLGTFDPEIAELLKLPCIGRL